MATLQFLYTSAFHTLSFQSSKVNLATITVRNHKPYCRTTSPLRKCSNFLSRRASPCRAKWEHVAVARGRVESRTTTSTSNRTLHTAIISSCCDVSEGEAMSCIDYGDVGDASVVHV